MSTAQTDPQTHKPRTRTVPKDPSLPYNRQWRQAAQADALMDLPLPEIELPTKPAGQAFVANRNGGIPCTICTSFDREEIEQWLVVGRSANDIARRFKVSANAVWRHKQQHMPKLDEDRAMRETLSRAKAVARLRLATEIHEHAARELANGRHHREASAAAKNLQEASKLAGQIGGWYTEKHQISGVIGTIDFNRLLADILRELQAYPGALAAIDRLLADRELAVDLLE